MNPVPYFIMGMLTGIGLTLFILAYGRRSARKALKQMEVRDEAPAIETTAELRERVRVLEQIITDRPVRLAEQIESLR